MCVCARVGNCRFYSYGGTWRRRACVDFGILVIYSMHSQTISKKQKSVERKRWENRKLCKEIGDVEDDNEEMLMLMYYSIHQYYIVLQNKIQFYSCVGLEP